MSAHSRALEVPAGVFSAAVTAPGADTRRGDPRVGSSGLRSLGSRAGGRAYGLERRAELKTPGPPNTAHRPLPREGRSPRKPRPGALPAPLPTLRRGGVA